MTPANTRFLDTRFKLARYPLVFILAQYQWQYYLPIILKHSQVVLIKLRCLLGSGEISYLQYAQLQDPRLFTSLFQSLSTTIVEIRISLRPRLSIYVECSFYTCATSTLLHSCMVAFLLGVLNYCRMQNIASS